MVISEFQEMFKISIIIPTYNRPSALKNCVKSILEQTQKPFELIIVDDGNLNELPHQKKCRDIGINYVYLRKDKPGLTESRNKGIELAKGAIIFFLDDDVMLFPNYIEKILSVYKNDRDNVIGGVGGVITNHKHLKFKDHLRRIFEIFFLISGFSEGIVLPSGFCTNYGDTGLQIKKIKAVDFLSGCGMSFRRKVFHEFVFTNRYRDYGLGEDKDFSYQVSKKYKLFLNPEAKMLHLESPEMRPDKMEEGRMFIMGRYMFFKQHIKKKRWHWVFFYYALFGYILTKISALLFLPDKKRKLERLIGVFNAIKDIAMDKKPDIFIAE